jgi:cytochrome c-type biogenesis protein CcmE
VAHKQRKFAVGCCLIVLAIAYLAYSGFQENRAYSYTVWEFYAIKDTAYGRRLQVTGNIVAGSIRHDAVAVNFLIGQSPQILQIQYVGKNAPDTLVAGATAIATGKLGRDGVFVADSLLVLSASTEEHA